MVVQRISEDKATRKYLERHAEPEVAVADGCLDRWSAVCVVPLHAEGIEFLTGVLPATRGVGGRVLLIAVVNGRDVDPPASQLANSALLEALGGKDPARPVPWAHPDAPLDVLCIDRASRGRRMPAEQGVGLARKIGADLALRLIAQRRVASPWIFCTDADVCLPDDYFLRPARREDAPDAGAAVALTYPFWHTPSGEPALDRSCALYELSLRYYVLGLASAQSPYAFHSIGSTLALDPRAYAQVRGFPRRRAGEDFYLLGKLAKLGGIETPAGPPIEIRTRRSDRVPFGTGAATRRWADEAARGRPFTVYDPRSFGLLEAWLRALEEHAEGEPATGLAGRALAAACDAAEHSLGSEAARLLARALECTGTLAGVERAVRQVPAPQRAWRVHEWFDGFRTLKLVHAIRDLGWPPVQIDAALATAPFLPAAARQTSPAEAAADVARRELARAEPRSAGRRFSRRA